MRIFESIVYVVAAETLLLLTGCQEIDVDWQRVLPWVRHTIDDSSRGADGVRLADVNADGLMDVVTGWEEGGRVRVCLHPGPLEVERRWPSVTVGEVGSPEDAVLVDLDEDGVFDVVTSCEGSVRSVFFHWGPTDPALYLHEAAWQTETLPVVRDVSRWMFCLPLQVDGEYGPDLVIGAKNSGARIGWLESPADARDLDQWQYHPIYDAGWIMSLVAEDMDGDGDLDVVASDRKGETRGCLWLENPGPGPSQRLAWPEHRIGGNDREVMFLRICDLDEDGLRDVLVATAGQELVYHRRISDDPLQWSSSVIDLPADTGTGKGVAVGDIDLDGQPDVVFTCEHASERSGVMWLSYRSSPTDRLWSSHEIGGAAGTKFDRIELIDLDGDDDLDVMTCEEGENLGVIWYENPARP